MTLAVVLGISRVVLIAYVLAFVLYGLFLSYCTLRVMRSTGRLAAQPAIARAHCYALLYFTLGLDVFFNLTIGTLLFVEVPELSRLTFTARCQKHMTDEGFNGRVARWVCEGWLNPGEPGHC